MIRTLPYLKTNLNAIFNSYKKTSINPLYQTIINNYGGKDYKNLIVSAALNKEKNIKLFDDEEWILYIQLFDPHRTFHYYNNTIIKHLDGGNIKKSSVGDQVFKCLHKNNSYLINSPTIIQNFDYSRASCLIFKYKKWDPYKLTGVNIR